MCARALAFCHRCVFFQKYPIYIVLSSASSCRIEWAVRLRILPRNAIPNCDQGKRHDKREEEEAEVAVKTAGTSSSNFQPNQLDNDKTSRTSPVVHVLGFLCLPLPPPPLPSLSSLFTSSAHWSTSFQDNPLPPSLRIIERRKRGKKREKSGSDAIPRIFLTPRCSEISAASGMTKNYPGYPENILSSLSHVWSHRRRSSLLSRIHTHLLSPLSHPSSLLTFLPFSPPFSPSLSAPMLSRILPMFSTPCFVLMLGLASRNRVGR